MPRITIAVEATVGSSIGRDNGPMPAEPDRRGRFGWPVGKGCVLDTLDPEGRPVEAVVLMREPALPGDEVAAWPVAVVHLRDGRRDRDEVVCVAEAAPFVDLIGVGDLSRWYAEPAAWAAALTRLSPGSAYQVTGSGTRDEADELVTQARHAYVRASPRW
ncbi:inorganic diphosphatase [Streptomyces sp. NPDC046685]|uniref:inorganic diphosphatase n=1 Tax=Streptomyces sp. NPDC046685 TaxID=3157202 RepID=UPI0033D70B5F